MTDNELDEIWDLCVQHEGGENWSCADHGQFIEVRRIQPHLLLQKHAGEQHWRLIEGQR